MEKRSLNWFEKRRRTKGLDVAYSQMVKAVDTIVLLHQAVKSYSEGKKTEVKQRVAELFATEEEVDKLRSEAFKELSKGSALVSDYREDLLHLVKRLDMAADSAKDAARCIEMLEEAQLPDEMLKQTIIMTAELVEAAQVLRSSIDKISNDPAEAINGAHKVQDIEHEIDQVYLNTKSLFVKYGDRVNCGSTVIFDDMIEFVEQAADLCADTADYIVVLSSRE
jgi:predicted phosphate transport protein (TIGR00153 family)